MGGVFDNTLPKLSLQRQSISTVTEDSCKQTCLPGEISSYRIGHNGCIDSLHRQMILTQLIFSLSCLIVSNRNKNRVLYFKKCKWCSVLNIVFDIFFVFFVFVLFFVRTSFSLWNSHFGNHKHLPVTKACAMKECANAIKCTQLAFYDLMKLTIQIFIQLSVCCYMKSLVLEWVPETTLICEFIVLPQQCLQ